MKTPIFFSSGLKKRLAVSVVLTYGLIAGTSHAQWIVNDPTSLAKAVEEYANQAQRWMQTVKQYEAVAQHYADQVAFWNEQLVKLDGLNFQLFTLQNQFKHIADDYGVKDACPGVTDSLAGDITSALQTTFDMGGDVVKQQRDLCRLIVMTKNKKYNDTVDYLQNVAQASIDMTHIQQDRLTKVAQSPGNLEANTNDVARYQGSLENARSQWESNMQQDDAKIQMLQQVQANLSRRAMQGSPGVLGTIVNAAALEAALK